jgi:MarR family transcriptional regulator for hemolysin
VYTETGIGQGQDLQSALARAVLLAGRRWRARLNERLKDIGQTDARCAALAELAGCDDGLVQRILSNRLGIEEPTVVRLIDALEAGGWVERQTHRQDRRAKVVRLTPAAQPVLDQAQGIVADLQAEMFEDMDPSEVATCLRVLDRLARKLERTAPEAQRCA